MADVKVSALPVSSDGFTDGDRIMVVEGSGANLATRIVEIAADSVLVGVQFSQAQSDKLDGIADSATAGLNQNEVDDRIRSVASEAIVAISQLDGNNRITFTRLDGQDPFVLDLSSLAASGGGMTAPPTPVLSDFRLTSTPESSGRIDATASLVGQRFITFNVRNHESVHTLELEINGVRVGSWSGTALTEGTQSRAYTILQNAWNQIVAANASELTFTLEAQDSDGAAQSTQSLVVHRAANHPVTDAHGYAFASSSDSPTAIPSSATRWDAAGNSWDSGAVETSVEDDDYLVVLAPEDSDLTSIVETTFNIESISSFTRTTTTINSVSYAQYVRRNQSGGTGDYSFRYVRSA